MLAAVGIYGVMAYSVARRTRDIGVRVALGARAADVRRLVLRQGVALAVRGVALGLAGAFLLSRLLAGLHFGVTRADPLTFVGVSALPVIVAALASYAPARHATSVDPLIALRSE